MIPRWGKRSRWKVVGNLIYSNDALDVSLLDGWNVMFVLRWGVFSVNAGQC